MATFHSVAFAASRAWLDGRLTPLRIAITGAGTSGLLLALMLQRQGHAVRLFEPATAPRTEGFGTLVEFSDGRSW